MLWGWGASAPARLRNTLSANPSGRLLPAGTCAVSAEAVIIVEGLKRVTELTLPHGAQCEHLVEHSGGSSCSAMFVSEMPKQSILRGPASWNTALEYLSGGQATRSATKLPAYCQPPRSRTGQRPRMQSQIKPFFSCGTEASVRTAERGRLRKLQRRTTHAERAHATKSLAA